MPAVTVTTDTTLSANNTLVVTNDSAYLVQAAGSANPSLTVDGAVTETWDTPQSASALFPYGGYHTIRVGYYHFDPGSVAIGPHGSLHIANTVVDGGVTYGIFSDAPGPTITNAGTIDLHAAGDAVGINSWSDVGLSNSGTLRVEAGRVAEGVVVHNGGPFANSGLIQIVSHGHSDSIDAVAQLPDMNTSWAVLSPNPSDGFLNTGTISIHSDDPSVRAIAVDWMSDLGFGQNIVNKGLIQGDTALRITQGPDAYNHIISNEGVLDGGVEFVTSRYVGGPSPVHFSNTGQIHGSVSFASTDDTYSGSAGVLTGLLTGGGGNDSIAGGSDGETLSGGVGDDTISAVAGANYLRGDDGNDSILGGSGFDDINGNKGDDTIDGGSGGDWLVGGQGNDMIVAHSGWNIEYGNLGNDTVLGGTGNDWLRGGQGDDSLVGGAGNNWISGDRGNDTEVGGPGADTFNGFSGIGQDRVLDFHVSEGDRVQLDPGTHYTVSQVGSDTVVDLGNGDQMTLVGVQTSTLPPAWIFGP